MAGADGLMKRLIAGVEGLRAWSGKQRPPAGADAEAVRDLQDSYPQAKHVAMYFAWLVVLGGGVLLAGQLLFSGTRCSGVVADTEFAGTSKRFLQRFAEQLSKPNHCELDGLRTALWRDYIFAALYSTGFGLMLAVWWNASWFSEPGYSRLKGSSFAGVALAAFGAEVIENSSTLIGLGGTADAVTLDFAPFISTIAWVKWMLVAILSLATIAMTLSWLVNVVSLVWRRLRDSSEVNYEPKSLRWYPDDIAPGLGVCLSGGGIRSAAFSLGAMSALEETDIGESTDGHAASGPAGVMGHVDLLASVSGGGYAASAWRIAAGTEAVMADNEPIIGDPNDYMPSSLRFKSRLNTMRAEPTAKLYPKLRERREYMRNGRGGLLLSALTALTQLAWHILLILATVFVVSWPLGRMVGSWIIETDGTSVEYGRLIRPAFHLAIVAAIIMIPRLGTMQGGSRDVLDKIALAFAALAALLAMTLVVLPWMTYELMPAIDELLPGRDGTKSTVATLLSGGIVASVWRVVQAPIRSRAQYLGGVLLALGLVLFSLHVTAHAASSGRFFSLSWGAWLALTGGYVLLLVVVNPDLWSLHWLYQRRLAQTFANRRVEGGWAALSLADQPALSAYSGAAGPKPIICAVAARNNTRATGIPVVSMTFDPDHVILHQGPDAENPLDAVSVALPTSEYEALLTGRMRAHDARTVFGAAALSGAAFAPSLGRMSMGTTNALIAALNLRLGMWMPNPAYDRSRRPGPHMLHMFKEMGGQFDLADPNIYVTDGGHWENLGLVELIRRRTRAIIAVDASGDTDYSFGALLEAIDLAQVECNGTRVRFVEDGLAVMRPDAGPMPLKNWCRAEIDYPDDTVGRLLFVKAQASQAMPLDVLRYSKEDSTFPNYSTANQFLKDPEFCNLAILGRESMIAALDDHGEWIFEGLQREIDLATEIELGAEVDPAAEPAEMAVVASVQADAEAGADFGPGASAAPPVTPSTATYTVKTPPRRAQAPRS